MDSSKIIRTIGLILIIVGIAITVHELFLLRISELVIETTGFLLFLVGLLTVIVVKLYNKKREKNARKLNN